MSNGSIAMAIARDIVSERDKRLKETRVLNFRADVEWNSKTFLPTLSYALESLIDEID